MKTALVTGGAGFIGTHLTKRLREDGWQVTVVDKQLGVNILNLARLKQVFAKAKPERVIHLAAEVGVTGSLKRPHDYVATNVLGTLNVLDMARTYKVLQVIFASSSSVYGQITDARGFTEDDPLRPVSPYGASKLAGEDLCRMYSLGWGLPITALRFFTVYGPGNRRDMACFKFVQALAKNQLILVRGRNTQRDFTYIDDVIDGVMLAIKEPFQFEAINLGPAHPVTVLQLLKTIEQASGKTARVKIVQLPKIEMPVTRANIDKAKKLLGWQPKVTLAEGVKNLVAWYNAAYA